MTCFWPEVLSSASFARIEKFPELKATGASTRWHAHGSTHFPRAYAASECACEVESLRVSHKHAYPGPPWVEGHLHALWRRCCSPSMPKSDRWTCKST
eukprot:6186801-Pleurochrysis_carterae.AAC.1